MSRKANPSRLHQVARLIHEQPGYRSGEYARMLECHRESFNRLLTQLEERGVLFAEDEYGRLWPFDERVGEGE